jgi:hypothetical protein
VGLTVSAVCQSCGALIDVANQNLQTIATAKLQTRSTTLALGTRGVLFETEWEIIGYCERVVVDSFYAWREYLLFNPWQGFRFLVESDGHWTFVRMLRHNPQRSGDSAESEGRRYKKFSSCNARVRYVMGEFYWRVQAGDQCSITDYVAPPYILSSEKSSADIIWSVGIYLEHKTLAAAFKVPLQMLTAAGIAPNQPNPARESWRRHGRMLLVAFALLIAGQMIALAFNRNQTLLDQTLTVNDSQSPTPVVLEPFAVPGRMGNIEITTSAQVDNHWLEADYDLVRQDVPDQFSLTQEVSYYHGYDSDGYWSEGRQVTDDIISAVPGGQYRLFISVSTDQNVRWQPTTYRVQVKRDVPVWSNFWLAFLALSAYPGLLLMRSSAFEKARWEESDLSASPFESDPRQDVPEKPFRNLTDKVIELPEKLDASDRRFADFYQDKGDHDT